MLVVRYYSSDKIFNIGSTIYTRAHTITGSLHFYLNIFLTNGILMRTVYATRPGINMFIEKVEQVEKKIKTIVETT